MTMRLQEVHPALVHFPITLLPLAVGADLLGRVTGSESLREVGRHAMPLAAAGTGLAALAGLVAQQEVKAEGPAHDVLITHRNLNLGLLGATTALAAWRWKREAPGAGYLALGLAGLGLMAYTAYLGGHMVYAHGVGVEAAGGLRAGGAPELTPDRAGEVAHRVLEDLRHGAAHTLEHIREGEIAPTLTDGGSESSEGGAPSTSTGAQ